MRVPAATYRIQFHSGFRFEDASRIVGYLSELGVTDIYASPVFVARPGSTHGYDVTDPTKINPELGGEEGLYALRRELSSLGMGWVQDIVPNHMAYDGGNSMLMDLLENGEHSPYRHFFDIDWSHVYESIRGRILAPFLGRFYGEALEAGEITLCYEESGLSVKYYGLKFPLRVESYPQVFNHRIEELAARIGENHPDIIKLSGTLHALVSLPPGERAGERAEQMRFAKEMLWELCERSEAIGEHVKFVLGEFNGTPGDPKSFDLLDGLLSKEFFRLSFWKVGTEEINYRRFFSINELISLRTEDDAVFDHTHSLILEMVGKGVFSGLRVDHIDGLYDPTRYLKKLKERAGGAYVVVEKILGRREEIPGRWPVEGTTGYDFLGVVNGLFCDSREARRMQRIYARHAAGHEDLESLVADKKRMIIGKHMAGDIDNLAHLLKTISGLDRYGRDITLYGLRRALVEVMAFFPAYRSYISSDKVGKADRLFIREAVSFARQTSPNLFYEFNFLEKCLLLEFADMLGEEERGKLLHFVMRFQQFTGPLMAKGFEDTILYVYNRLISLNEVGGDPGEFGTTLREFHLFNARRQRRQPHALSSTATHDTKRGEDMRVRISVLSEIPDEWEDHVKSWRKKNARMKKKAGGREMPDGNDEYFIYQTLLGSWPTGEADIEGYRKRLGEYVIKAVREAKVHTAWLKPDDGYESAALKFVDGLLGDEGQSSFMKSFIPFQRKIAFYGALGALSQAIIKATAPGVPDIYQGTELWDLSFVDPDNRRPVNFDARIKALQEIVERSRSDVEALVSDLISDMQSGKIKLFLLHRALAARKQRAELFLEGDYIPIEVEGKFSNNAVAFARRLGEKWSITVAPRLLTSVVEEGRAPLGLEVWGDTRIQIPAEAPALWREMIAGGEVAGREITLGKIFSRFPAAMLFSG